ncbi:MAG: Asp-tRNA(Asn)/Glu-tRNA(Gln) amidotransferase subunit GatC [Tissierellia bacterium]|nr:Asp-tRNA(Asn)/Glu-tRNA(Gln) amidotransferase subunit GatC [Tissierellia bacterium]
MKIEQIKHIANIAKIHFEEEELEKFAGYFNETMDLLDSLQEVSSQEEALLHVNELDNHFHEDIPVEGLSQEEATANAPTEKYGYIEIIRFVD